MPTRQRRLYAKNNTAEVICQLPFDTLRTKTAQLLNRSSEVLWRLLPQDAKNVPPKFADIGWWYVAQMSGEGVHLAKKSTPIARKEGFK